jgi:dephospho-CoA kinase
MADGSVDREALARFVLDDPDNLSRLNAAIHPLVRRRIAAWLDGLSACHHDETVVAVIEAALLVETGGISSYDLLAVVWCRPGQQLERAVARGMSEAHARALLAAQAPLDEKRAVADIVIDNSGDRGALDAEVDRAWTGILARCRPVRR